MMTAAKKKAARYERDGRAGTEMSVTQPLGPVNVEPGREPMTPHNGGQPDLTAGMSPEAAARYRALDAEAIAALAGGRRAQADLARVLAAFVVVARWLRLTGGSL